jgi:hypothetical protein
MRVKSPERVAHELAFAVAINEAHLVRIKHVLAWQNDRMPRLPVSAPAMYQNADVRWLSRELHAQAHNPED